MEERINCEVRHERISRRDGSIDILARSTRTRLASEASETNSVVHIDSTSGRYVTSTDQEHFLRLGTTWEAKRTFWDKRVPLSLSLRSTGGEE